MTPHRLASSRLLAAALAAFYSILAMTATGPHAHDLRAPTAAVSSSAARQPALTGPASSDDSSGRTQRPVSCPLCVWSRSASQPVATQDCGPTSETHQTHRPAPDPIRSGSPLISSISLRAPPAC